MLRVNGQPKENYAGLLPKKGWPRRNYRFLRHQIVPSIFKRRDGESLRPELASPQPGNVAVTWIGHATFLLQFAGTNVVVDPNWALWHGIVKRSKLPGVPLDHLPPIDLILVTHAHFDHLHKKSLRVLDARHGIIVPRGSGPLVRSLGFRQVMELGIWDEWTHGPIQVIHTPAFHWGARYWHDTHRDYGGYIIRAHGKSVFHCGDSAYFDGFLTIGASQAVDVAIGAVEGAVREAGGALVITADHGNLEMMRDPATGQPHTAHTVGPVPLVYMGARSHATLRAGGALRDVAPTLLDLLGLPQPVEMTGQTLFNPVPNPAG